MDLGASRKTGVFENGADRFVVISPKQKNPITFCMADAATLILRRAKVWSPGLRINNVAGELKKGSGEELALPEIADEYYIAVLESAHECQSLAVTRPCVAKNLRGVEVSDLLRRTPIEW